MTVDANIPLFCYGTLQQPEVQRATFGRLLEGRPDRLAGHRLAPLVITSAEAVALSGAEVHTIACRTVESAEQIPGTVYLITPAELAAADDYETDAYARREVRLASGASAFVYVGPDD